MDTLTLLKVFFALVIVVSLIGLLAWTYRRYGMQFGWTPGNKERRLGVREVLPLDPRNKLVLIRRDDVDHLLLISTNRNIVIESGIKNAVGSNKAATAKASPKQQKQRKGKK